MRKIIFLFLSAACMTLVAGCGPRADSAPKPFIINFFGFRKDIRTITVSVPKMGSLECSRRVQDALAKTEGVRATVPNLTARTVQVEYDAIRLGIKNIEYVIAAAGFDANTTIAREDARKALPAECR